MATWKEHFQAAIGTRGYLKINRINIQAGMLYLARQQISNFAQG